MSWICGARDGTFPLLDGGKGLRRSTSITEVIPLNIVLNSKITLNMMGNTKSETPQGIDWKSGEGRNTSSHLIGVSEKQIGWSKEPEKARSVPKWEAGVEVKWLTGEQKKMLSEDDKRIDRG